MEQDNEHAASPLHEKGTVSTPLQTAPSLAFTESLLGRSVRGLNLTPMEDLLASPKPWKQDTHNNPPIPHDFSSMMAAFSQMLARGLSQTAAQITALIHADLQHIGAGIEVMEKKTDQTVAKDNQNSARIQDLSDQLETAISKIDDLEN